MTFVLKWLLSVRNVNATVIVEQKLNIGNRYEFPTGVSGW